MSPQQQYAAIGDTLKQIQNTLTAIDNNPTERARLENTDLGKSVSNVFGAVGDVLTQEQQRRGIVTSSGARKAIKNAQNVVPTETDSFAKLQQEYQKLTTAFAQEKANRKALEADLSIADKRLQQQEKTAPIPLTTETPAPKLNEVPNENNIAPKPDTTGLGALTVTANGKIDPVALAQQQALAEFQTNINNRLKALNQMVEFEDEDTKATVRNIEANAQLAIQRIERENARLTQAARVAGIVSGRAQYSPYEHEGVISEVIQEGFDRITEIENTKIEAQQAAKKAFREFRYKAYLEGTELVAKLSEMKLDTITAMAKRLQEVEQAQREKLRFDQEQAERNAFILAPELIGMSNEDIIKTAYANGIEPGLLMRTVAEYEREQKEQEQADQAFALNQELIREKILSERNSRFLANQKAVSQATKDGLNGMTKEEREWMSEKLGWNIPPGMSADQVAIMEERYSGESAAFKERVAAEQVLRVNLTTTKAIAKDIVSYVNDNLDGDKTRAKQVAKYLGVKYDKDNPSAVFETPKFREVIASVNIEGNLDGIELSTSQIYESAIAKIRENQKAAAAKKNTKILTVDDLNNFNFISPQQADEARRAGLIVTGTPTGTGAPTDTKAANEDLSKLTINQLRKPAEIKNNLLNLSPEDRDKLIDVINR